MSDATESTRRDAALVERFLGGDPSAFDEIVREHRMAVYQVARRLLGSHEDADEAAQETFVRAWRSLDGFRAEASLRTWLVRIAMNVAHTAGSRRRPLRPLDDTPERAVAGDAADAAAARGQTERAVRAAVAQLPPRQREVVTLKVFSDMTYDDVAAAMGLTAGAVKAHLHQAVANLRRLLGPAAGEGKR